MIPGIGSIVLAALGLRYALRRRSLRSPLISGSGFLRATYAVKKYGDASDPAAREVRVPLG